MNPADPLAELRDIHLPEAVAWWPPAFGWWLLLVLLVACVTAACWWLLRRYRASAYRRSACTELRAAYRCWENDRNHILYLQTANAVLKRVALLSYPKTSLARLSGIAWCEFLDRQWPQPPSLAFADAGLAKGIYRDDAGICEVAGTHEICLQWLRLHRGVPC